MQGRKKTAFGVDENWVLRNDTEHYNIGNIIGDFWKNDQNISDNVCFYQ